MSNNNDVTIFDLNFIGPGNTMLTIADDHTVDQSTTTRFATRYGQNSLVAN